MDYNMWTIDFSLRPFLKFSVSVNNFFIHLISKSVINLYLSYMIALVVIKILRN